MRDGQAEARLIEIYRLIEDRMGEANALKALGDAAKAEQMAVAALRFLYGVTLDRPEVAVRPRVPPSPLPLSRRTTVRSTVSDHLPAWSERCQRTVAGVPSAVPASEEVPMPRSGTGPEFVEALARGLDVLTALGQRLLVVAGKLLTALPHLARRG